MERFKRFHRSFVCISLVVPSVLEFENRGGEEVSRDKINGYSRDIRCWLQLSGKNNERRRWQVVNRREGTKLNSNWFRAGEAKLKNEIDLSSISNACRSAVTNGASSCMNLLLTDTRALLTWKKKKKLTFLLSLENVRRPVVNKSHPANLNTNWIKIQSLL